MIEDPGERARIEPWRERSVRSPSSGDRIDPRAFFGALRRRGWLILLCVVAGTGGAWGFAQLQEPRFRATAIIRIDDPRVRMISGFQGIAAPGRPQADPVLSALEVLRSQGVLGQIVDEEGLQLRILHGGLRRSDLEGVGVLEGAEPDTVLLLFTPTAVEAVDGRGLRVRAAYGNEIVLSSVRFRVARPRPEGEARLAVAHRQRAISDLAENLQARPRESTDAVEVEFVSTDPLFSQRVVNRAVEVFRERAAEQARRESLRRRAFLEEQLSQADSTLQQTQRALSQFRSREQVFSSREWFAAQQAGLLSLELRQHELVADRRMFSEILEGFPSESAVDIGGRLEALVASPEVAQNPVVARLFEQLIEYETARDSLGTGPWSAAPDNPDLAWANQQIQNTRTRLDRAIRSHLDALDARIEALHQLRRRQEGQIQALPEAEAEESRLLQQVESIRRSVDELTSEVHRAQVAEAVEEGVVEILDLAPLPLDSEQASLPFMLMLGGMLGLVSGGAGALLLDALDMRIRHKEDLGSYLDAGMVGVIPRIDVGMRALRSPRAPRKSRRRRIGKAEELGVEPELVTVLEAASAPAEAFRTLRTNLLFASRRGKLTSLVVTSPLPGEGKSTTAANLAVSFGQQGLRVLAVDCDLRQPRLHGIFGIRRTPGLTELLAGDAKASEVIRAFGAVRGVYLLPSGRPSESPTELLGGARMRALLRVLEGKFDLVLFDTPPLAAGADAAILGAAVDGVLMVVRAGRTHRDAARQAADQLDLVGANVVGAILNDPSGEAAKYGYAYGYGTYGSYGSGAKGRRPGIEDA